MANSKISVHLSSEPTRLARLVIRYRLVCLLAYPFIRFMPIEWLFHVKVEGVDHG